MHTPAPKEANPAMTSRIAVDFFVCYVLPKMANPSFIEVIKSIFSVSLSKCNAVI